MTASRQLHLGAFMRPVGIHTAWWRYPGAYPDANFNLKHLIRFAQTLERGRFDAWFMADHLAVLNMPMAALMRSATVTSFDPLTLLPVLAMVTEHLGLIATASTTFEPAYTIARRFASLDHISGGRAAWNLVTTSNPDSALNFGLTEHMEHGERYRRAREFFDVVTGLWDSWADDAFIRDVEEGIYFDPERLHVLDHKGEFLSVRGPLNIARPIQGWPVIVQAGASDAGRQLAAETAEMIFASGGKLADAQRYYADVRQRAKEVGRDPDHIKILPGCLVVVGDTAEDARQKRALLDSLVHPDSGIASLSIALGHDASGFDLDGPLPEIPESNASKSGRQRVIERARRDKLTVRQLAQTAGSYGGLAVGSTSCSHGCRAGSTISSTGSCPNYSAAACSAASTRARPCARTSACRAPRTAFSRSAGSDCSSVVGRDDAGPDEARVAVGVVSDAALVVEDHRRAVRRRVGGPGRYCRIVCAAVASEGDPGR
jgi:FMN-dependent oxidoreductase (nitrilotriacetate monooxygenase family)